MLTRRSLLLGAALARAATSQPGRSHPFSILDPNRLPKFVDPLPIPPRAIAAGTRTLPRRDDSQVPFYSFTMREFATRFHRDLPAARVWGFDSSSPGPTIDVGRGQPILVEWRNALPAGHLFRVDHSLHGAGFDVPDVRSIIHVHGLRVAPADDGYPENWYRPGESLTSLYPNRQDAATLWYHDHAMSITRLNLYAGLVGFYLIRDDVEASLQLPAGKYEIPIMLYDRSLTTAGQLYYPVSTNPDHPWVGAFAGEAVLANGRLYPFLDVEPRAYRLRLANVSNSRFLYLALSSDRTFWQIATDQGLLAAPIPLARLTLAPGERADIIVDFADTAARQVILSSDSLQILQFRVTGTGQSAAFLPPFRLRPLVPVGEKEAVKTRQLTLGGDEDADNTGAMIMPMTLNGASWHDPVTEDPALDSVEIWSLINLTDDSHPIHLHLVRFQILDRRPFDLFTYLNEGQLNYLADPIRPEASEAGWKDTVRADPGMVTRIIVRFEGYVGRYVWHCHILEHEDNDMMRPYDIVARS